MKRFYTIFRPVFGVVRAKKNQRKNQKSRQGILQILSAKGARGSFPLQAISFKFPLWGKLKKLSL